VEFLRQPDWTVGDTWPKPPVRCAHPQTRSAAAHLPAAPRGLASDHRAALTVLRAALRGAKRTAPELRGYEVWTPLSEHDHAEDITEVMPRKLRALRAHRSQLSEFNYERAVRGLNQFRGELAAKCRFAEVFQTLMLEGAK